MNNVFSKKYLFDFWHQSSEKYFKEQEETEISLTKNTKEVIYLFWFTSELFVTHQEKKYFFEYNIDRLKMRSLIEKLSIFFLFKAPSMLDNSTIFTLLGVCFAVCIIAAEGKK